MTRTALLALAGVPVGLLIATAGTLMLARARAAGRATSSSPGFRADVAQYSAAVAALIGFLLASSAVAVLCAEMVPFVGVGRTAVAGAAGVAAFALLGVAFSRLADHVEEGRPERVPTAVYAARPADPPALTGPERRRPVLPSGQGSAGPTSVNRKTPPDQPVPADAVLDVEPSPDLVARMEARRDGLPTPTAESSAPADAESGPDGAVSAGTPDRPDSTTSPDGPDSTKAPDGPDGVGAVDKAVGEPAQTPEDAVADPAGATSAETPPTDARSGARGDTALDGLVRPGWVYRDAADDWYMAVAGPEGGCSLVALPTFCLVGADRPTYPLRVAGAGELAVVPLTEDPDVPLAGDAARATSETPRPSTPPPD